MASNNETEYLTDVENVLFILSENNFRTSVDKCDFFKDGLIFLGYPVTADGSKPRASQVYLIVKYPYRRAQPSCAVS